MTLRLSHTAMVEVVTSLPAPTTTALNASNSRSPPPLSDFLASLEAEGYDAKAFMELIARREAAPCSSAPTTAASRPFALSDFLASLQAAGYDGASFLELITRRGMFLVLSHCVLLALTVDTRFGRYTS